MATCPVCDADIEVDGDEIDSGDTLTCDECGADLRVVTVEPKIELAPLDEDEDEDDEDDDEEDEDEDEDSDLDEDEDEDEEDEDWK